MIIAIFAREVKNTQIFLDIPEQMLTILAKVAMLLCMITYFFSQALPDFQVNSENYPSKAIQNYPIAAGFDSGCVVVWNDNRMPSSGTNVYGVRQNITGDTCGRNFRISGDTTASCTPFPDVQCDFEGNFAVAWRQFLNIRYRKFSHNGTPVGPPVQVNSVDAYCSPPAIDLDSAGYTVITWSDNREYNEYQVYGQIFDPAGSPVSTNLQISDSSQTSLMLTDVKIDNDRYITAVWRQGNAIWCQRLDSLGIRIGENFQLWTDTLNVGIYYPGIECNEIGDYLIAWSTGQHGDVFCRLFDSMFIPQSGAIKINDAANDEAWRPRVAVKDSTWFIAFENNQSEIYLQKLSQTGTLIGNNIRINEPSGLWNLCAGVAATSELLTVCWARRETQYVWDIMSQRLSFDGGLVGANVIVSDDVGGAPQYFPAIAADTTGRFFVVWDDFRDPEYMASSQYGRLFDAAGNPLGGDFRINEYTDAQQSSISLNNLGLYITLWARNESDSNHQVYGQRFDRNGVQLGPNFQISCAPGNSVIDFPRINALSNNQFVTMWTDYRTSRAMIYGRLLDPLGIPQGNEFSTYIDSTVNNVGCSIVDEENGKFILAMSCDQESIGIAIQEFDYSANPTSPAIILNDSPAGYTMVSGTKGLDRYLFVWTSQDSLHRIVYGQFIDESLQPISTNFPVSEDTISYKDFPSVASDQNGQYFVMWYDTRGGYTEIYGQFLDSWSNPIGHNFKVTDDTTKSEKWLPSCYSANNLIYLVWSDARIPSQWYDIYCKVIEWPPTYVSEHKHEPALRPLIFSPNPFRGNLNICGNFDSITDRKATIDIHDACGRLVRQLSLAADNNNTTTSIQWDGKDNNGNTLPAGVYFVILPNQAEKSAHKVVRIR